MAYLAPLQEMNGNWTPYGSSNPAYFKSAFQRIVTIFAQEGVTAGSVRWVFAPNGQSSTGWPGFEDYYPGDAVVDAVGFSSYNYGYNPNISPKKWETPDQLFTNYVSRMRVMAPSKPVFIAQTGTSAYGPNGYDASLKNQWLEDAYHLVSDMDGVRGILYYNDDNNFDWAFYRTEINFVGYKDGVSLEIYQYIPPVELVDMFLDP
jgi:beta-mannanase